MRNRYLDNNTMLAYIPGSYYDPHVYILSGHVHVSASTTGIPEATKSGGTH